jgi:hypothetical protein
MATLSNPALLIWRGMSCHTKDFMRLKKRRDFDVEIDFEVSTFTGTLVCPFVFLVKMRL